MEVDPLPQFPSPKVMLKCVFCCDTEELVRIMPVFRLKLSATGAKLQVC